MQVTKVLEKLAAKDAAIKLFFQASCATLKCSIQSLATNFHIDLNRSVVDTFPLGSPDLRFYADTIIDGITFQFSAVQCQKTVDHPITGWKLSI